MRPASRLAAVLRIPPSRARYVFAAFFVLVQAAIAALALYMPARIERLRALEQELGPQVKVTASARVPFARASPTVSRSQFLVLAYQSVQEHPTSPNSVTPAQFADHLSMLSQAGYTAATTADLEALLNAQPVRGRKVLITFDGGGRGIWTYVDPILSQFRMRAVAFIPTANVGTHRPYYVTWPELVAMHRSGRWDFGSQSHLGRSAIPSSPTGGRVGFFSSQRWISPERRYETISEYRARVDDDLVTSKTVMKRHGLPSPRLLALPYDSAPRGANESQISKTLTAVTRKRFDATFRTESSAGSITSRELSARLLPRIKVTGLISAEALFWRLHRVAPVDLMNAELSQEEDWCCTTGNRNLSVDRRGRWILLGARTGWRFSTYGPGLAAGWSSYRFTANANGLDKLEAAALRVVGTGTREVQVLLTDREVRVVTVSSTAQRTEITRSTIPSRYRHRATVTVHSTATTVSVDGIRIATLRPRKGGIGLAVFSPRPGHVPWFSDVSVAPSVG